MLKKITFESGLFIFFLWVILVGVGSSTHYRQYVTQSNFSFGLHELFYLRKDMIDFIAKNGTCPEKIMGGGYPVIRWGRPSHVFDSYQMLPLQSGNFNTLDSKVSCLLVARFKSDPSKGHLPEELRGKIIRYVLNYEAVGGVITYSCHTNVGADYSLGHCQEY